MHTSADRPELAAVDAAGSNTPSPERKAFGSSRPRVELIRGPLPRLRTETQQILRVRLRAASLVLFTMTLAFLLQSFATGEWLGPQSTAVYTMHVVLVIALGISSVLLWSTLSLSLFALRVAELLIFGLPSVYVLVIQHVALEEALRTADAAVDTVIRPQVGATGWYVLMFTYAMFIPNTWRRAAAVLGAMALAPLALAFFEDLRIESIGPLAALDHLVPSILMLGIGVGAAVFGTHMINTLRVEAFAARQLGQYRLRDRLGTGGMGEVYLAEHRLLKRPCAIKVIRPGRTADRQAMARFEREVQTTAHLSHWNTVEIFDYGRTEDGTFYYVMEYLPGLTLRDLVARHGPLPPERVIHLLRQTCAALREAHRAGLIHRDIKPGNIFASQRGGVYDVAKLLDFGLVLPLAKQGTWASTGELTGSPLYMSPEQILGDRELDGRSDIYSLGAVAYFLLTGEPPYEGAKPLKVMIGHVRDPLVPPSARRADVPSDLEQVILRCLEKEPGDRFTDVDELVAALEACESSKQWTAERAERWWQEHGDTETGAESADRR